MTTLIQGNDLRTLLLGRKVTKSTGTLAATTVPLFTVAGGAVFLTSLTGRVTTIITVANAYKLQHNPTLGTTVDLCTTLDIGTSDSVVGEQFSVSLLKAEALVLGAAATKAPGVALPVGQIEHVSAGTDGVILWTATYIPLEDGATLVAA
jgi:hypothetical protein